jgi:multicomponent Na+:H+ antiporter subunit B
LSILRTIKRKVELKKSVYAVISGMLLITILSFIMAFNYSFTGSAGEQFLNLNATTGSANVVTTVVTFFRGFDTLGEISVLFLASTGIGLLLQQEGNIASSLKFESNFMLKVGSKLLFPLIVLFGVYIIVHGHLSPGGGFQGGVVIANAFLLLMLANSKFHLSHSIIAFVESSIGVLYVIVALMGLFTMDTFLGNFLPHSSNDIGLLFSAGIIPIVYIIVGIKVGSEMSAIVENILRREETK